MAEAIPPDAPMDFQIATPPPEVPSGLSIDPAFDAPEFPGAPPSVDDVALDLDLGDVDLGDLEGMEIEAPELSLGGDVESPAPFELNAGIPSFEDPFELVSDPALSGSFDEMLNMVSPDTPKLNEMVFSEMSPQQLAAFSMAEFWQGEKVGDAHRQLALQNLQKMSPELAAIVMTTPEYRTLSSLETDKVELLKPSTWGAREWLMATGLLLTTYGRFSQSKQEQRNLDRRYELDERNIEYQRMIAQAQIDIQREKLEYEKNRGGGAVTVPKSSVYF